MKPSEIMEDPMFRESLQHLERDHRVTWQAIGQGGIYVREGDEREIHEGRGGQLGFVPFSKGEDGKIRVDGRHLSIYPDKDVRLTVSLKVGKGLEIEREKDGERDKAFLGDQAKDFDQLKWDRVKEKEVEQGRGIER